MEQDHLLRRDESLTARNDRRPGLLIAAHGERGGARRDESIIRLVEKLAACNVACQVGYGLIKGEPSIGVALNSLLTCEIIVYPMFLADGYFAHTVLPQLLKEYGSKREGVSIRVLPSLGLDPALAELVTVKAAFAIQASGFSREKTTLVFLAHGSKKNAASRIATEDLANRARHYGLVHDVRVAFLDESPSLIELASEVTGPIVVVGLFAGNGLHGADDMSRLISTLRRDDIVFVGNVTAFPELVDLMVAAVKRA